ncbi:hypothetical protein LCGC14_1003140 [marine sediment metagenome]|uniref:Uncharacterized protein n=1 Tax=marine sediment metagenome TaxID=412755 RepID=A0A0F9N792_9ZZZZ
MNDQNVQDFAIDTVEAYEALSRRVKALEEQIAAQNEWPRVRVNVKQLAKGELRFDTTYEDRGVTWEEALAESDKLVAACLVRYPVPEAG